MTTDAHTQITTTQSKKGNTPSRMVTPTEPDAHGAGAMSPDVVSGPADERPSAPVAPPHSGPDSSGDRVSDPLTSVDGSARGIAPLAQRASGGDRPRRSRRLRTRQVVLGVLGLLMTAFLLGSALVPLPYYLFRPGSVHDTEPLIEVTGTEVHASDGSISYTTVSLRQATLVGLAQGWLDDDIDIVGRSSVLRGRDVDENRQVNLQMMDDSKHVATQVALERLGYDVNVTVGQTVGEVMPGKPADGVLDVGDTIVAIDGETFDDAEDLGRLLADDAPGDTISVTLEALSDGAERTVDLTLVADADEPDRGVMGVGVLPRVLEYDFPVDVEIDTGGVGGPSAGLAFTLAIIDDLTAGDLTGGSDIAVTGTILGDGTVGEVGGTGQKAAAVRDQGLDLFLVPRKDYRDAVEHAGDDLEVVAVDTLDDALAALAKRGGNGLDLARGGGDASSPAA
jgi:PDZ domain-containing protein